MLVGAADRTEERGQVFLCGDAEVAGIPNFGQHGNPAGSEVA
jgi:hypothetical protein